MDAIANPLITGNRRASLVDRKNDLYETPPVAVFALAKAEALPHHIWEPCCGPGSIVEALRSIGHQVTATDLVDYDCPVSIARRDFLMERSAPDGIEAIVTNPPFKNAEAFVEQALLFAPKVVMLLRLAFLESDKRRNILENSGLSKVHVFRNRLPMMHRHGWEGNTTNSAMSFAWFVWERGHKGPAILNRISWTKSP